MKRLMLDFYRRWWWVLALAAMLEVGLGWTMARRPADPFEFWAFMLALWCSATLLSFDFRRGMLRPVALLPLKAREIGRSWWLATVPIPALALTTLLFLGAGLCCHFRSATVFPTRHLVLAGLFTFVWLGIGFTMIFNATRGPGESRRGMLVNSVTSLLCMVLVFGSMLLNQGMASTPWRIGVLLGLGAALTVVGWWRAERFEPGRAWLYLGRIGPTEAGRSGPARRASVAGQLTPLELKPLPENTRVPSGRGGAGFLIRYSTIRSFTLIAALLGLMALVSLGQNPSPTPENLALRVMIQTGSYMCCGFVLLFQVLPVLRQLRLLRTLPISAARLAGILTLLPVLPLAALGALASLAAWSLAGAPTAVVFLKSYTFILAPASLCVFFALWRGEGPLAYVLMGATLFGFLKLHGWLMISRHTLEVPATIIGAVAVGGVGLSYLLACWTLERSSRAYRLRTNLAGSFPWGGGR